MTDAATKVDPDVMRLVPDSDLSEHSFVDAVGMLKVAPAETTLVCSHQNACEAQKISDVYRCRVVLVPNEILANGPHSYYSQSDTWCVMHGHRSVWSPGA